jgi:hypothetical protein
MPCAANFYKDTGIAFNFQGSNLQTLQTNLDCFFMGQMSGYGR